MLSVYVCDGYTDCPDGEDESSCNDQPGSILDFNKHGRSRLDVHYLARWLHTSKEACALHCIKTEDFECRSFNYHATKRLCTLNEQNIGMSGKLITDSQWDYYELGSKSTVCEQDLR